MLFLLILMCMDSQWLRVQFDRNPKKTKTELARALGLEPSAISKILKGTRQIKAQEYIIMRRFFGLTQDEPQYGASESLARNRAANSRDELQDALVQPVDTAAPSWTLPAEFLKPGPANTPRGKLKNIRVVVVNDNVMAPDFEQGEHVLIDCDEITPNPAGLYAISDGFADMIRICEAINDGEVRISAYKEGFHAQILSLDEVSILGRVMAKLDWI